MSDEKTEKKKNEEIAKWAGFEQTIYKYDSYVSIYWTLPDKSNGYPSLPDFYHDLNALFKWVMPKLQMHNEVVIRWSSTEVRAGDRDYLVAPQGWSVTIFGQSKESMVDIETTGISPTNALCLAVEKLIDIEAKNE